MRSDSNRIIIEGYTYSVKDLSKIHPGGPLFLEMFSGQDATNAFMSYHRRKFPHHKYYGMKEFSIKPNDEWYDKDYLELCEKVAHVIPLHKSFAPLSYYIKIFVLLGSAISLEYYMHYYIVYKWYLAAFMGLLYALIGLNIQHDANHGAISRHFWVNRILGLTQNWIGGSAISWIHQHVVQHHIFTNDIRYDPDISGTRLLRLNPIREWQPYYSLQYIYFFALIGLYGWTAIFDFIRDVWTGINYTKMSQYVVKQRRFDLLCSCIFITRWVAFPIYQTQSIYTIIQISPMMIVAGYYLAFFFILSHNFVGTKFWEICDDRKGFLYRQVTSSSNVGGEWLCFLNGGLNYQIEHHLFPRMNHTHYPKVAPIVKEFCKEKNIPYLHFDSITENLQSTIQHLYDLGNEDYYYDSGSECSSEFISDLDSDYSSDFDNKKNL